MRLDATATAVVTGGGSGLGAAVTQALTGLGVRVTIFDLNQAAGQVVASQTGAAFAAVDVTSQTSVEAGFAHARRTHGQERILVNCAGIVTGAKTVGRDRATGQSKPFPMDLFERTLSVNLVGAFRCLTLSAAGMVGLPALEDGERGVIINTGSIAATDGQMGQAAYAASKAGLVGLNLPVARDLASDGIRINAVLPGIMNTPMIAAMSEESRSGLAASVPFPRRLGQADEFASLVLEICRNRYLNGEAVRLDGAVRMAPRP